VRLVTYDNGAGPRAGVLQDDRIVDAAALLGTPMTLRDVGALVQQPNATDRLRDALAGSIARLSVPAASVRLRAPVIQPPTVRDYIAFEEHATGQFTRETTGPRMEVWARLPVFYFSNPLKIAGPEDVVPYPAATQALDYECELGVVIGKEGTNVLAADADEYIAGFTIYNDWSCRDLQSDEQTFGLGPAKGKDAATSLGPVVVTLDEMAPYYQNGVLNVRCQVRVNGVTWMDRNAWNQRHTFRDMIERASQDSRIVPGDVLGSGTVGSGSISESYRLGFPARFLEVDDVVEMEVEGIGVLRNTVGAPTNPNKNLRFTAPSQRPLPERLSEEDRLSVLGRVTRPSVVS
jgi:fumarylacetoacetate (FAA) hydrolase